MNHGPIIWAAAAFVCLIGQTAVVLQASCEASIGDHLRVECTNRGPFISLTWIGRPFRSSRGNEGATPTRLTPASSKRGAPSRRTSVAKNQTRPSCCSLRQRKNDHFPRSSPNRKSSLSSTHSCLSSFPNEASPSHADADTPTPWFVFLPDKSLDDFSVVTCLGSDITMLCEARPNHDSVRISWKRRSRNDTDDVHLSSGQILELDNVKRKDGGSYVCQVVSGEVGVPVERELNLVVEYPPVIFVGNAQVRGSWTNDSHLRCVVEAFPEASVTWYKDDALLGDPDDERYKTGLEGNGNCTLIATLLIQVLNDSNSSANDSVSSQSFGNYTCVAENKHGKTSAVLTLVEPSIWDARAAEEEPRPFNVTGFIIGMCPPLFISFYIILKLGYRSRYAQEHPDDGGREEPFFVSY